MVTAGFSALEGTLEGGFVILRNLSALDNDRFDIVIIGGGIHGAALASDAVSRGLRVALIEKADFGSGSSGNSLRILHGGLRYLQTLDFVRFKESVAARKWYARQFPNLVKPLPCLMPLYGDGARRPSIMRAALALNDLLSLSRNRGLTREVQLPGGRILDRMATREVFPCVRENGLLGAALWHDYQMISSERVLIEMLSRASAQGAVVANYAEATRYLVTKQRITGVVCADRITGRELCIQAPVVVNCAGPACSELASYAGCAAARFAPPSVAFNVLFESDAMGATALGVASPDPGAPVHFICPSRHGLWAGTAHVARDNKVGHPQAPSEIEVERFIAALRKAVPAFSWSASHVRRVYWGVLPVKREATIDLTARPEIVSHQNEIAGLYSVVGIKFTTAVQVAEQAMRTIFGSNLPPLGNEAGRASAATSKYTTVLSDGDSALELSRAERLRMIQNVASAEAVFDVDDMLLRRTNWLFSTEEPALLRAAIAEALPQSMLLTSPSHSQTIPGVH